MNKILIFIFAFLNSTTIFANDILGIHPGLQLSELSEQLKQLGRNGYEPSMAISQSSRRSVGYMYSRPSGVRDHVALIADKSGQKIVIVSREEWFADGKFPFLKDFLDSIIVKYGIQSRTGKLDFNGEMWWGRTAGTFIDGKDCVTVNDNDRFYIVNTLQVLYTLQKPKKQDLSADIPYFRTDNIKRKPNGEPVCATMYILATAGRGSDFGALLMTYKLSAVDMKALLKDADQQAANNKIKHDAEREKMMNSSSKPKF